MSLRATSWLWGASFTDKTFETGYTVFSTTSEVWYLGFERRFDALLFTLSRSGSFEDLTIKYWGGDSWNEFGCSYELDGTDYVRWNIRADVPDWVKAAFTDAWPESEAPASTIAGCAKERYWLQISVATSVTTPAVVTSVQVIPYAQYATARDISNFLQLSSGEEFDLTTHPTENVVEDMIRRHESSLEKITRKSWRVAEATETREFRYSGIKVSHSPIKNLVRVRLWQGANWRTLHLGRTGECYSINDLGMVFFTRFFVPVFVPYSSGGAVAPFVYLYMVRYPIEITYQYGDDFETHEDAGLVEHTIILMTAVSLLQEYEMSILTKSGVDKIEQSARVRMWREEIEENLKTLTRAITVW